jgi:hypothetical protein
LARNFGRDILFKGKDPLVLELHAGPGEHIDKVRNLLKSMEGCATSLASNACQQGL